MKADQMPLNMDLQEKTLHGTRDFPLQYYVDELFLFHQRRVPLHWHSGPEFFVVRGGCVEIQVWEKIHILHDGEGVFLNGRALHSFFQPFPEEQCQCPNVVFSSELLAAPDSIIDRNYIRPILQDSSLSSVVLYPTVGWQAKILQKLDRVFSLCQKYGSEGAYGKLPWLPLSNADITSECYEMEVQSTLNQIWQILYGHKEQLERSENQRSHQHRRIRFQRMLTFLQQYYADELTLSSIAESASVGKSEATRCFQEFAHAAPMQYLLRYRLTQACSLLRNPEYSISEISEQCGFHSAGYFSRMFRQEYGMTPGQYRSSCQ